MILPRRGRMAWYSRMRPPSALPPAESPSTRYSSHVSTSRLVQSRSLPGSPPPASAPLRSRTQLPGLAGGFAGLGRQQPFCTMILAVLGFSSRYLARKSPTAELTMPSISLLPSLVLVWPSNCGSGTRSEMTAVRPSRKSSPLGTRSLKRFVLLAVGVERARERGAEAGDVRAALGRADVVDVGVDVLGVLARVLHGDFHARRPRTRRRCR